MRKLTFTAVLCFIVVITAVSATPNIYYQPADSNWCGPAAILNVLAEYGEDNVSLEKIALKLGFNGYRTRPGTYPGEITTYINWHTNLSAYVSPRPVSVATMRYYLKNGANLILLIQVDDFRHYIVVEKYKNGEFWIIDSLFGYYSIPVQDFQSKWIKNMIVVWEVEK